MKLKTPLLNSCRTLFVINYSSHECQVHSADYILYSDSTIREEPRRHWYESESADVSLSLLMRGSSIP